eukprot:Nitzschia sp. Nitz4//scaffold133_size116822//25862//27321//NITZ4_003798-RA/size116822-augustus-gene-0.105-mRNA-1//1//CDS//3329535369//6857//frame0
MCRQCYHLQFQKMMLIVLSCQFVVCWTQNVTNDDESEPMFPDGYPPSSALNPLYQRTGLVHVGGTYFLALIAGAWVRIRRKERIVTAAQPQFLYLIVVGMILMITSLVFVSFDESNGWTQEDLDKACSGFPWFFVTGYLVQYCAVFSRLWRVSKLLSVSRRAVDFKRVVLPFLIFIGATFLVLTAWQLVAPFRWNKTPVKGGNEWDYVGGCSPTGDSAVVFTVAVGLLFAAIMVMTLSMCWRLRMVDNRISETPAIAGAVLAHLLVWPLAVQTFLVLVSISRDAYYLMATGVIAIFANVLTIVIIWPKAFLDVRSMLNMDQESEGAGVHQSDMSFARQPDEQESSQFMVEGNAQGIGGRWGQTPPVQNWGEAPSLESEIRGVRATLVNNVERHNSRRMRQEEQMAGDDTFVDHPSPNPERSRGCSDSESSP